MFPYYWNGYMFLEPNGENILNTLRRENENLPEEVLEALELHKDEMYSLKDKERYMNRLDLRK